jgi:hypothetical protein
MIEECISIKAKTIDYGDGKLQNGGHLYRTSEKHSSHPDSLKGLAIRIAYKGVVVKKWYSDRALESLTNW